MAEDAWETLKSGDTEQAIHKLRKWYAEEESTSNAMELGVTYLWVQDFEPAWQHFDSFNRRYPYHVAATYGMAGVAKWCLKDSEAAVHQWRIGLNAEFTDWAGGVEMPLLLFFASVAKPQAFPGLREEAEKRMVKLSESHLIKTWPGPLAEFALGRIDEEDVRRRSLDDNELETQANLWQADFYSGVLERIRGNREGYTDVMKETANVSWNDYDASKDLFLLKLWREEFFLARHESKAAVEK